MSTFTRPSIARVMARCPFVSAAPAARPCRPSRSPSSARRRPCRVTNQQVGTLNALSRARAAATSSSSGALVTTSAPTASSPLSLGTFGDVRLPHAVDRAQRGLDLGRVHGRALDLEHVVEPAVVPEVAVGIERAEVAGRVEAVGGRTTSARVRPQMPRMRFGPRSGSRRSRRAHTARRCRGRRCAPRRRRTAARSCPACPRAGRRSRRSPQYGPNDSVMPNRFARAPGAGRWLGGSTAGRLPGAEARQVGAREPRDARRGAAAWSGQPRNSVDPLAFEERERALRLGHRLGEQRRAGDEHARAARRRGRPSRRTASGCRGGRPAPTRRASELDATARSALPCVWTTPFGAPRLPEVNRTTKSSAGRTRRFERVDERVVDRRRSAGRRASHTARSDGSRGCRRPAAVIGDDAGRDRVEVVEVRAAAERPREHEVRDRRRPASCASSSGGRSSVLSGTSTPPMPPHRRRDHGPLDAVGQQQPDARALADAGGGEARRERAALVVELGVA